MNKGRRLEETRYWMGHTRTPHTLHTEPYVHTPPPPLQHYTTECTESLHSRLHTDWYFFHPPASEQYSRLSVNYSTWSQTSYKRAHIDHRTHVNDASFMQSILTATLNSPCTHCVVNVLWPVHCVPTVSITRKKQSIAWQYLVRHNMYIPSG